MKIKNLVIATCLILSPAKAKELTPEDLIDPSFRYEAADGNFIRLSSYHYKLAKQCGLANAAMIEQMPELYPNPEKAAHQMAKMQASMFGLNTKDEIEQFIETAEMHTLEQLETLNQVE